MKTMLRAVVWSAGLEVLLLALVLLANHARLGPFDFVFGILAYLALACHAPAVWLLCHWSSAQETLLIPALVQWLIWFIAFLAFFRVADRFHRRTTPHEAPGS
jgi:hypothetical protein